MTNINLTSIIEALLGFIAALIAYRVIPWIKAKTNNEQQAYITGLIKAAVFAAEQIYSANGMGAKKMEFVRQYLAGKGFDVDTTAIEAVVSEYINNSPFNPSIMLDVTADKPPNNIDAVDKAVE